MAGLEVTSAEEFKKSSRKGVVKARIVAGPWSEGLMIGALITNLYDRQPKPATSRYLLDCVLTPRGFYPNANIIRRNRVEGEIRTETRYVTKLKDAEAMIRFVKLLKDNWQTVFDAFEDIRRCTDGVKFVHEVKGTGIGMLIEAAEMKDVRLVRVKTEFLASDFTCRLPAKIDTGRIESAGGEITASPSLGSKGSTVGWENRKYGR